MGKTLLRSLVSCTFWKGKFDALVAGRYLSIHCESEWQNVYATQRNKNIQKQLSSPSNAKLTTLTNRTRARLRKAAGVGNKNKMYAIIELRFIWDLGRDRI